MAENHSSPYVSTSSVASPSKSLETIVVESRSRSYKIRDKSTIQNAGL